MTQTPIFFSQITLDTTLTFFVQGKPVKKEITSFDIAAAVLELKQRIMDAWVTNIYQTGIKTLILKLHQPDQPPLNLLIKAGNRLHLTGFVHEKPLRPSAFCMMLRKYLRDGRIQTVEQYEFERIVTLRIKAKQSEYQIIAELFGEGNIILADAENKILQALSYRRMRDRNILRNAILRYPPPSGKNPFRIERKDLDDIRSFGQLETVKALARFIGVGGFYAEEILLRAHVDKNATCDSLGTGELDRIFSSLRELLSKIETRQIKPAIIINEKGEQVDVVPFPVEKYAAFHAEPYPFFNEALDRYYAEKSVEEEIATATTDGEQLLAQQERILSKQQKTLKELEQEIERNKKIGELIYTHFSQLQLLTQKIMEAKDGGKSWSDIASALEKAKKESNKAADYYSSLDPKNTFLQLSIDGLTFPINLRRSIQENAAEYYDKSKKAQKRHEGAEKALSKTKQKISELEKQKIEKMSAISEPMLQEIEKKEWYEKFHWFHSSEGFLVIGGKDATTNEILVKKHMESRDIVFHADITGAPFVIVKTEGRQTSEETIKQAAEFAASFSKAWKEMFAAVDVYWVHPEQVSKTPPTGQFLSKGSFMIYGKKNYLRKVPLQTALGVMTAEDGQIKVIGGPKDAVAKQTKFYVEMMPGDNPSGALAKYVRDLLAQKVPKEQRETVLAVSLDRIQNFIPSGKGRILL
jgi:predicted ribosome quality control (RQC) complex YloA/Tae2 family protein